MFFFVDSLPKLIEQAVDTLELSPLGQILGGIKLQDEQMAVECYIDDFIHIVYSVKSEPELQVTFSAAIFTKKTLTLTILV